MRDTRDALKLRFGDFDHHIDVPAAAGDAWQRLANRGVCRRFRNDNISDAIIDTLCALALSSPSKSDLQQRDLLIVEDPVTRARINDLLDDQDWLPGAPHFIIFLGNNRRQRQIHDWRGHPFVNDHLDAFFNAAVDGAIALSAFVNAAEAIGIGCCPVSVIRNYAQEISDLCELPDHVFPVAGLAFGWPSGEVYVSARLPLKATVHRDRFDDKDILEDIQAYDERRNAIFPFRKQRDEARFGHHETYGWSEDKARQYARSERADFGAFVRRKKFNLE